MNLLIGLAVDDITGLQAEGQWRRLRHQANFIVYLENVASNRFLRWILPEKVAKLLIDWISQDGTFTIHPAMLVSGIRLSPVTLERARAITAKEGPPVGQVNIQDTYNLVQQCADTIQIMARRMENLEHGIAGEVSTIDKNARTSESQEQLEEDELLVDADQIDVDVEEVEDDEETTDDTDKSDRSIKANAKVSLRSEIKEIKAILRALQLTHSQS